MLDPGNGFARAPLVFTATDKDPGSRKIHPCHH